MRKLRFVSFLFVFMFLFVTSFSNFDVVFAGSGVRPDGFHAGDVPFTFSKDMHYIRDGADIIYTYTYDITPDLAVTCVPVMYNSGSSVYFAFILSSLSPFSYHLTKYKDGTFVSSSNIDIVRQNSYGFYSTDTNTNYFTILDSSGIQDYDISEIGSYMVCSSYTDVLPAVHNYLYSGTNDVDFSISNLPSFDSDSAEYSSDLGHLENVTVKQLDTDNDKQIDCFRFAWNRRTSTGVDLDERGYDVEYLYEMKYSYTDIFGKQHDYSGQTEKLYISDKSDRKSAVYEYSSRDSEYWHLYFDVFTNTTFSPVKTLEKKITFYARPIYFDGENSFYGDLTTVNIDPKIDSLDYDVSTDNGDGTTSSSSGSTTTGCGDSLEEALDNSVVHDPSVDIGDSDIPGVLSNFTESVKSFQVLFTSFFSFMPQWVLAFLIACIVIWCIMIVKKAILG